MRFPATIALMGICILSFSHLGHCDSNTDKYPHKNTSKKAKPLSIRNVIDCEFPEDKDVDTAKAETVGIKDDKGKKIPVADTPLLDFSEVHFKDKETSRLLNDLFTPTQKVSISKSDAYMEVANALNMRFISKGYKNIKQYEKGFSRGMEKELSEMTSFKVRIKPDVMRLKVTSSIELNEYHKIDVDAGAKEQSIIYKVQFPVEKILDVIRHPEYFAPISLPLGAASKLFH